MRLLTNRFFFLTDSFDAKTWLSQYPRSPWPIENEQVAAFLGLSGPDRIAKLCSLVRCKIGCGWTRETGVAVTSAGAKQSFYLFRQENASPSRRRRQSPRGALILWDFLYV